LSPFTRRLSADFGLTSIFPLAELGLQSITRDTIAQTDIGTICCARIAACDPSMAT
jgi:hypothetical protein